MQRYAQNSINMQLICTKNHKYAKYAFFLNVLFYFDVFRAHIKYEIFIPDKKKSVSCIKPGLCS